MFFRVAYLFSEHVATVQSTGQATQEQPDSTRERKNTSPSGHSTTWNVKFQPRAGIWPLVSLLLLLEECPLDGEIAAAAAEWLQDPAGDPALAADTLQVMLYRFPYSALTTALRGWLSNIDDREGGGRASMKRESFLPFWSCTMGAIGAIGAIGVRMQKKQVACIVCDPQRVCVRCIVL